MNISVDSPLFVIPVSAGFIFVIVGLLVLKFPPKKINNLYGFRTANSMKSQQHWDFAQRYSAKEMIKLGALLALSGLLGLVFQPGETVATAIGIGFMMLAVIALLLRVEGAIKKEFPPKE